MRKRPVSPDSCLVTAVTAPEQTAAPQQRPDGHKLFAHTVRKDETTILDIAAVAGEGTQVIVEATVTPWNRGNETKSTRWSHTFPNAELAKRFIDETVVAFEYLNCDVG